MLLSENMHNDMILHVDGDNFFVSCELTRFPSLKGKPVIVGEDRGIACAMSPEAKALGITRGMPVFKIRREFPQVVILTSHFELYQKYSDRLNRILKRYSYQVEEYSIDECFAILRASEMQQYGSWEAYLSEIKKVVQGELGVTFSFGIAQTKVLAKIASSVQKPNGCTVLDSVEVSDQALKELPIEKVWGIGRKLSKNLKIRGIDTAFIFAQIPLSTIEKWYGKPIQELWLEMNGKRMMSITHRHDLPKSLQTTRSFQGSTDKAYIFSELSRNIEIICARMRQYKLATNSMSFFLKHGMWEYTYDYASFSIPTSDPRECIRQSEIVFNKLYEKGVKFKATGVTAYGLIESKRIPKDMFGYSLVREEDSKILSVIDSIRTRFGRTSINFASSIESITAREKHDRELDSKDPYIYNLPLPYLGEVH